MTLAGHAQVIGRAWEAEPGMGEHRVTVAVGLDRAGALVEQLQQQAQIEMMQRMQREQAARFRAQQAQIDALHTQLNIHPSALERR